MIPAGAYHLLADGITVDQPNVRFGVAWRHGTSADVPIVSFSHPYPPGTVAQYEEIQGGAVVAAAKDDLLVLRVELLNASGAAEYIPIAEHPSTPTARMLQLEIP